MRAERGVFVDHDTLHRWFINMLPVLAAMFRRRKRPLGRSWRMDETYVKVKGQWKSAYALSQPLPAGLDLTGGESPVLF